LGFQHVIDLQLWLEPRGRDWVENLECRGAKGAPILLVIDEHATLRGGVVDGFARVAGWHGIINLFMVNPIGYQSSF
jgi:hypothetical protein